MRTINKRKFKKKEHDKLLEALNKDYEISAGNIKSLSAFMAKFKTRFPNEVLKPSRSGTDFSIWINKQNLTGLKDKILTELLEFLLDQNPKSNTTAEYLSNYNVDYKFFFKGFYVVIGAYIKHDSENCRRIVVGEDTHYSTTPRYQLVCD